MTKLDKILLSGVAFFVFFVIFTALVKNYAAAAFIALLFAIMVNRVFIHLYNRYHDVKEITTIEMINIFSLWGIQAQTEYLVNAVPKYFSPKYVDNSFEITYNTEKILVFPLYRYTLCSEEDIARMYRSAKSYGINNIWLLSKPITRSVALLANNLEIKFTFIHPKRVRSFLRKQNKLPEKPPKREKNKRPSFKEIISETFTKRRAKYFIISCFSLGMLGFFTPLKAYYFTVSVICGIMGIVCLLRERF